MKDMKNRMFEKLDKGILYFVTLITTFFCCSFIGGIIICSIKIDFRYVTKIKKIINEIKITGDVFECRESLLCILLCFFFFVCLIYFLPILIGFFRDIKGNFKNEK